MMIMTPIAASDVDVLERGGHLDVRLDKDCPATAISHALVDLLHAVSSGMRSKK